MLKKIAFNILPVIIFLSFQTSVAQNTAQNVSLELNKPIEREIKGKEKHSYQFSLPANQYALIVIEQRGIDITTQLSVADGKKITDFNEELRPNNAERIEFTSNTEGIYQFDVKPAYEFLPSGIYEIRLAEIRPANAADNDLFEAHLLYEEAVRLANTGKYPEAQKNIEQAMDKRRRILGEENILTLRAKSQLAFDLNAQDKFDEALQLQKQILSLREKTLDADHSDIARSLVILSDTYVSVGDMQTAVSLNQRAAAIYKKAFGNIHPTVALTLSSLCERYSIFGDQQKALESCQEALAISEKTLGKDSFMTALILGGIGAVYNDSKDYEKTESYLLRSIEIMEKLTGKKNRIFMAHYTLADVYFNQGKLDQAEELYLRFLEFHEKSLGADHEANAAILYSLANIYSVKGNFEKAETFYRRALKIRENTVGSDNSFVSKILNGLALLLAQTDDVEQAIKLQQRAAAIDEKNISLNLAIGSERQKLGYLNSLTYRTNQNFFLQTRFAPENQTAIELAVTTLLRQKGRVTDAVSNNLTQLRRRFNPQDQLLLDKFNEVTEQLAGLILNGPKNTTIVEHQAKIKSLSDKRENLEDEISRRADGFYIKPEAVTLPAVRQLIPSDSALIEFAVYTPDESSLAPNFRKSSDKPRYIVYVIPQKGTIKWKDIGQTDEIDRMIDEFRQSLRDPKRDDVKKSARSLDEKVIQPIRAILGNAQHLLVSPDGELNLIPFEALVDEQNHYLIENYSFTYLTSGRDLLRMQTARTSKSTSLLIANPLFGVAAPEQTIAVNQSAKTAVGKNRSRSVTATRNMSDTYFAPLQGTTQEARLIQMLFPDATSLTGAQATETALKQTIAPQILHIATHGFFLEDKDSAGDKSLMAARDAKANVATENPLLRSGLALAGANLRGDASGGDDGILTALEASGLNLWGTKLVVLSACDTGLGEIKNGEGVYGLRRSFVLAGAESMVMSLWSVSDYATRELMTNYYKNLKAGIGRGESLRKVQLAMIKRKERAHPFYWAGFIQSGEWANLDGKR